LVLVLIALLAAYSGQNISDLPTPPDTQFNNHTTYRPDTSVSQDSQLKNFWDWTTKDSASFYTFVLAIFTGILSVVSIVQGIFLYRADRLGRDSLTSVQRAFVFIRNFETTIVNNDFIIAPLWENSGSTPAENQVMWV
jgi:hypothetical protein